MRGIKTSSLFLVLLVGVVVMSPSICSAVEGVTEGRKLYNTIMLWVNFGILVAVFLKFARKPLVEALRGVRAKIEGELNDLEGKHNEVKGGRDSEEAKLKDIQQHLDEIKARILEMGEKEKQKIIEQAKVSAEKMITDAKAYAKFQMDKARKELSDEMIDIAISKVEERLKKEITAKDNERLVSEFLGNLEATKAHLN